MTDLKICDDNNKSERIILVFEPTFYGYSNAVKWLMSNSSLTCPVYRLMIPFFEKYMDYGDYLIGEKEKKRDIVTSKGFCEWFGRVEEKEKYEVKEIKRGMHVDLTGTGWPFESSNREIDIFNSFLAMKQELFLSDWITGFSPLEVFLIENCDERSEFELLSFASRVFCVPFEELLVTRRTLFGGEKNWVGVFRARDYIPVLLLKYGVSLGVVLEMLTEGLNNPNSHLDWESKALKVDFAKVVDGRVTELPLGVSHKEFVRKNGSCQRDRNKLIRYTPTRELLKTRVTWGETIPVSKKFSSMNRYMKEWMAYKLSTLKEEEEVDVNKNRFIRGICLGVLFDMGGGIKKKVLECTKEEKKIIIDHYFNSDYSLLDLNVKDVYLYDSFQENNTSPDQVSKFWIEKINSQIYNFKEWLT